MGFGGLGGGLEGKGSASGGLQGASRDRKTRFWSGGRFPRNAPNLTYIVVSEIFKKKVFFLKLGPVDFQGGPGRVPGGAFGAPAASQGALGKADEVQGGPFLRVLDRQKFARAQFFR